MTNKPEDFQFDEIQIGEKRKFTVKINDSLVNDFAKISGDYNPLHMDENHAKTTAFKHRICHGMLLASFFSRLVGMHLPGINSLYFSQTLDFESPCYIGDEVIVEGEVIDKSKATKIITIKTTCSNQSGKRLLDGIAKVIVR
jgi:acyl dehydratase